MDKPSISRRQWLGRVAAPTVTIMGTGLIGAPVLANAGLPADDKLSGTRVYNICDFGARGDGKTVNTAAIQKAIDACFNDKGGTVLIPAGTFVSGTLELKSHITL